MIQIELKRTMISNQVYKKISNWILEGILGPGEKLNDKQLAEQLGVSRMPIREAMIRLKNEGFIESFPGKYTRVSKINLQDITHHYDIVRVLETFIVSDIIKVIQDKHINLMVGLNERFLSELRSKRRLAALRADQEFHQVYIDLSRNSEIKSIISTLKFKLLRLDFYYFDQVSNIELSYKEHSQIIDGFKKKNLSAVIQSIKDHHTKSPLSIKN